MAKVYSWEVSNSPKKYAYIVHPDDYSKAYVGTELKGTKLENVKNWAAVCTDTQYEAQFNKMVALCKNKGYNVEFETAIAYMDVESTCDNLRGPAGRGIDHITLKDIDEFRNVSIYEIVYDDGETDTFEIRNGKDGQNGRDGRDGAQGDAGVSSKLIMIYTSGVDSFGNTFTPARPTGGSYDFDTYEFTRPDEGIWNLNDSNLTPPIWMSSRTFSSSPASTDKEWSFPVQLTGESGKPGADGVSTEFIYYRDKNEPNVENLDSPNEAGYVPPKETGWTASPQGVDEDNQTEWASTRKFDRATNVWGKWSKAFRWSQYGVNGQDGDGIQYIYLKNAGQIVENPTPANYKTNEDYQNKDNEWVPTADVTYTNINGVRVKYSALEERTDDLAPAGVWTDNPSDLTANFHSQWVCSRKYRKGSDGKMAWDKFSDPALWARYGQDGKNATSIRKLYALSSDTKTYPPIPEDTTATSEWGSGFPKDYKVGENVVWAIEAEIWAHNFEFVKTYKIVSGVDEDGNVVPPADATMSNTIDVQSIPNEEVKGYDYIRLNGDYYAWSGGWGIPYVVTGVKGESGDPINYTTYVYAFGYTNYPPEAPTGTSPKYPGESTDGLGSRIVWEDFPNSKEGRIDGYIDPSNNQEMRWYQCVGHVNGRNGEIETWSGVQPCNGHDGMAGPQGNRTEVRFGVTADSTKPILVQKDEESNEIKREPELYDSKDNKMGWFATDEKLPPVPSGGAMWQIWALIDGATDSVIVQDGKGWNGPVRVSGEKGEQGLQGPAGMRGVTGVPGATSIQMYCLGTYGKDEKSESYWETGGIDGGDGYFGGDNWKNKALIDDMDGWFIAKDMPYSNILKVYDLDQLNTVSRLEENAGRVVNLIETSDVNVGATGSESTFTHTTNTYYLISKDGNNLRQLTPALDSSEEFNVYVWCIQGNEIWQSGSSSKYVNITKFDNGGNVIPPEDATSDNTVVRNDVPAEKDILHKYILCNNNYYEWKEIDGDRVTHVLTGIEWGSPFKLQGTNGLRGLSGTRGQVVYPMGVYNSEEVYITTEDKAPYVYDPNDGMYYVYNNTAHPWLGRRPGYDPSTGTQGDLYKTILVHPDDAESNFIVIDYDPLTASEIFGYKYVYYKDKYYTWNGTKYVMASKYKYSIDGSGADGTWIPDQHGDAPANNYANAINADESPQWVRFESFKALYTSIGIIENGLVGSAVFNNEFMFSQQGIDEKGNKSNYAQVSGKRTDYGFLSGYEYDEKGIVTENGEVLHWYYAGTDEYIPDYKVNPYEKYTNGDYVHTFMPNVCINFATGQMWLQCGNITFGQLNEKRESSSNVYTKNEVNNIEIKLNESIKEYNEAFSNDITTLQETIEQNKDDILEQVDKKAELYYRHDDPSKEWSIEDAENRIGDMWYDTDDQKSYIFAKGKLDNTKLGKNSENNDIKDDYYWAESNVPQSVYDKIDGKNNIFIKKPEKVSYNVGDLWTVDDDYPEAELYGGTTGVTKGTMLICMSASSEFSFSHWGDMLRYADDAEVKGALKELIDMGQKLDEMSNDELLDSKELRVLSDELVTIQAEYPGIYDQGENLGLTTEIANYKNAYEKVVNTIKYYCGELDKKPTTSINKSVTIEKEGDYDYDNILNYYKSRQTLLTKISAQLDNNISQVITDYETAIKDSNDALKEYVDTQISTQIDNVISTYYGEDDPSKEWNIEDVENKLGDMWYDTNDQKSYIFAEGDIGDKLGKESEITGYYWAESNVPQSVYDKIDGKNNIFITKPENVSYNVGDLWIVDADDSKAILCDGTTGVTKGTILICVTASTAFNFSHWGDRVKYADNASVENAYNHAQSAITMLGDWASDEKLSPEELKSLGYEKERITNEFTSITESTETIELVPTETRNYYSDTYTQTIRIIDYYLGTPKDDSGCVKIVKEGDENYDVDKDYSKISNYYVARQELLNAISAQLEKQIDNKLDSYYQSDDPSKEWSIEDAENKLGDLWFNTNNKTSYTFGNDGYKWVANELPAASYNVNNKNTVLYPSKPTRYNIGDITVVNNSIVQICDSSNSSWVNVNSIYNERSFTIYTSIVDRMNYSASNLYNILTSAEEDNDKLYKSQISLLEQILQFINGDGNKLKSEAEHLGINYQYNETEEAGYNALVYYINALKSISDSYPYIQMDDEHILGNCIPTCLAIISMADNIYTNISNYAVNLKTCESDIIQYINKYDNGGDNKIPLISDTIDPSLSWDKNDKTNNINSAWFNINNNKSYRFTIAGILSENPDLKGYWWVESDIPEFVYDKIDGKASIYITEPNPPYHVGDMWIVHNDNYIKKTFADNQTGIRKGIYLLCVNDKKEGKFDTLDWKKLDIYADENTVNDKIDNKISEKQWLYDTFGNGTSDFNGAVLGKLLGVKNNEGNIVGYFNGSEDDDLILCDKPIMLGIGVESTSSATITLYAWCYTENEEIKDILYTTTHPDYINIGSKSDIYRKNGYKVASTIEYKMSITVPSNATTENTTKVTEIPTSQLSGYTYIKYKDNYFIWSAPTATLIGYLKVSCYDSDGSIIPPSDATDKNTYETPDILLPTTQMSEFTYVKCNNAYYRWADENNKFYHNMSNYDKIEVIVPPNDATSTNSLKVDELPLEENTDYKYIIYNNKHYKWIGYVSVNAEVIGDYQTDGTVSKYIKQEGSANPYYYKSEKNDNNVSKYIVVPTKIYNDGEIEVKKLTGYDGDYYGKIHSTGEFRGKLQDVQGDINGGNITNVNINNSNIILNDETELSVYDNDNNKKIIINNRELYNNTGGTNEFTTKTIYFSERLTSTYGSQNLETISEKINVINGTKIRIPSFEFSGRIEGKLRPYMPNFYMRVVLYDANGTVVYSNSLDAKTEITDEGISSGGNISQYTTRALSPSERPNTAQSYYMIFNGTTTGKLITVDNEYAKWCEIQYQIYGTLSDNGSIGANLNFAKQKVKVEYPKPLDLIEIGSNGLKYKNGNTMVVILPGTITMTVNGKGFSIDSNGFKQLT